MKGNTKGAFVGSLNGTLASNAGNYYFGLVNFSPSADPKQVYAIGGRNSDPDGVSMFDSDTDSYDAFMAGDRPANPYDSTLTTRYNGIYPMKDVFSDFACAHYGDWPSPEVLVVNS